MSILVTPTKQSLLLLFYVNDLPQDVVTDSLLYANDPCIVLHLKIVTENEKQLLRDFSSLCDWFVDNKLSVINFYFTQSTKFETLMF